MKCLVPGGGGFLGTHLCAALRRLGHGVRVFERFPAPAASDAAEWVVGEFTRPEQIDAAVAGCDLVFHLVSTTLPQTSNDDPAFDVHSNVEGSLALLDAARRHRVAKVVFISSGGTVYGIPQRVPIAEDHPTDPICSHGIAKLAIEKYLHLYRVLHGLDYCVLRLANPYGELQRPDRAQGAVAVFLNRVANDMPIEIWGDGSVVRDYVYVGDAVDAMVAAAFTEAPARLYNIGSGRGTSLLELIAAIGAVTGSKPAVEFKPGRVFDVPTSVLDISRARAELDWLPRVSLNEGLRRTYDWLLAARASGR
jgi:UDP-glucose 4-epimerase